jgi:hypothetical protein
VDIVLYSSESVGERPEQAAKPTETGDASYSVSRLSSAEGGASSAAVDQATPTGSSKEQPSSIPASPASVTNPASVGQGNSEPAPAPLAVPPQ